MKYSKFINELQNSEKPQLFQVLSQIQMYSTSTCLWNCLKGFIGSRNLFTLILGSFYSFDKYKSSQQWQCSVGDFWWSHGLYLFSSGPRLTSHPLRTCAATFPPLSLTALDACSTWWALRGQQVVRGLVLQKVIWGSQCDLLYLLSLYQEHIHLKRKSLMWPCVWFYNHHHSSYSVSFGSSLSFVTIQSSEALDRNLTWHFFFSYVFSSISDQFKSTSLLTQDSFHWAVLHKENICLSKCFSLVAKNRLKQL